MNILESWCVKFDICWHTMWSLAPTLSWLHWRRGDEHSTLVCYWWKEIMCLDMRCWSWIKQWALRLNWLLGWLDGRLTQHSMTKYANHELPIHQEYWINPNSTINSSIQSTLRLVGWLVGWSVSRLIGNVITSINASALIPSGTVSINTATLCDLRCVIWPLATTTTTNNNQK